MKTLLTIFLSIFVICDAAVEDPPNILFVFLDDFGWKDTSYMGSDFYETPNIDKLAAEGMVFTNAYSAAANCVPARACLLSGQYTSRHEIYNVGTEARGKAEYRKWIQIPGVHTPIQAKKDLVAKYEAKTPGNQHNSVAMATMIQAVDDGVGEIVSELDRQGLTENTVIRFFSDNGGYGPATDMAPLKGYKGT